MTVATMAMLVAALMWTYVIGQIVRVVAALTERSSKMDGMMDAAILIVYEARCRPAGMQVESVLEAQRGKILRSFDTIGAVTYENGAMPDLGEIGLACLLDYLDFRQQLDWRDHAPQLVSWLADFAAAVPGYEATMPAD